MKACKVLVGPIAFDRVYEAGESICLSDKDAGQLAQYGLLEIVGEVQPTFPSQIPVVESVAGDPPRTAPEVASEPVAEIESVAGHPPSTVSEDILSFPVVDTVLVAEFVRTGSPSMERTQAEVAPEAVAETIVEPTPEAVIEPVVETPIEPTPEVITEPVVETSVEAAPIDETATVDGEDALNFEEVSTTTTGTKRRK